MEGSTTALDTVTAERSRAGEGETMLIGRGARRYVFRSRPATEPIYAQLVGQWLDLGRAVPAAGPGLLPDPRPS